MGRTSVKPKSEESFDGLLRDGVSSFKSYIALKQKHRSPVYLAFKPFIHRPSGYAIYIGGKLSAFGDTSNENWNDNTDKQGLLSSAWRKLPKDRISSIRVGSNAGVFVIAGTGDYTNLIDKLKMDKLVKTLLDAIDDNLNIEIENRAEVSAYLVQEYNERLKNYFVVGNGGAHVQSPRVLGKASEVLFGSGHAYAAVGLGEFLDKSGLKTSVTEEDSLDEDEDEVDED